MWISSEVNASIIIVTQCSLFMVQFSDVNWSCGLAHGTGACISKNKRSSAYSSSVRQPMYRTALDIVCAFYSGTRNFHDFRDLFDICLEIWIRIECAHHIRLVEQCGWVQCSLALWKQILCHSPEQFAWLFAVTTRMIMFSLGQHGRGLVAV